MIQKEKKIEETSINLLRFEKSLLEPVYYRLDLPFLTVIGYISYGLPDVDWWNFDNK